MLDESMLAAELDVRLDWRWKAVPPSAHGLTLGEWLATRPHLDDLGTPLMTLDAGALAHNTTAMADWCAERGLLHAPHGKTTMAPSLWDRQLRSGAHAITLANVAQLRVARAFGVPRVLLANEIADAASARWIAEGPGEVWSCVDSEDGVAILNTAGVPLNVLVDLGGPGGRAGARTIEEARKVAAAVTASQNLTLAGVFAWEGAVAHDASAEDLAKADTLLTGLRTLHESLDYGVDRPIVTAGGSAFFDQVAEHLAGLPGTDVILRSGSYITNDDGTYAELSPGLRGRPGPALRPALRAYGRVISRPEPGLAIVDAGRRDVPFDAGLPIPLDLPGTRVTQLNDQHIFLTGDLDGVAVGDRVRFGISHPCTAFDKWALIPVLDAEGFVTDAIRTYFG